LEYSSQIDALDGRPVDLRATHCMRSRLPADFSGLQPGNSIAGLPATCISVRANPAAAHYPGFSGGTPMLSRAIAGCHRRSGMEFPSGSFEKFD